MGEQRSFHHMEVFILLYCRNRAIYFSFLLPQIQIPVSNVFRDSSSLKEIYPIHIQHHIEYFFLRVNTASWHVSLKCPILWQGSTISQCNIPNVLYLTSHIHTLLGTSKNDISQFSWNTRMGKKTEIRKQSLYQMSPVVA